ncbi:unnamed protein product [marine sediment metagenome]|uniref:Uncharacterized protein n=1 Tax=marine sediment metagenome TaxID=412755 RepID=X1IVB5_9ZZZZ
MSSSFLLDRFIIKIKVEVNIPEIDKIKSIFITSLIEVANG